MQSYTYNRQTDKKQSIKAKSHSSQIHAHNKHFSFSHTQTVHPQIHTHTVLKVHQYSDIHTHTHNATTHTQQTKTQVQNHTPSQELAQARQGRRTGARTRGTHVLTPPRRTLARCAPPPLPQSHVSRLHVRPQSLGLWSHTQAVIGHLVVFLGAQHSPRHIVGTQFIFVSQTDP